MNVLRRSFGICRRYPGPALLVSVWIIFFSRILSGRWVYFLDDLKIIYFPLETVYAQFQRAWQLPVWSNYFGFGQPLLAWGQLGFFTPVHVILRAMRVPPLDLLQISVLVYFALGLWGMYAWLKLQRLKVWPATLGAIVFVFSGFNIGHLNHVNFYTGTMLLPWLLLATSLFLAKPTLRAALWVALVAAIMALSAQPQIVSYCFVLAGIIVVAEFLARVLSRSKQEKIRFLTRAFGFGALAIVLALGLSSFATLPLREFLPLTERAGALPLSELYDFSYPPFHAITLIFPYFFGDHSAYWGPKGFQELAAFTGIIPLLLAGYSIGAWRQTKFRALKLAGIALLAVSAAFALGQYSPFYSYLVENHWLTSLSIPGRFVMFFDFGIAILAAVGLSETMQRQRWTKTLASILAVTLFIPFLWELVVNYGFISRGLSLSPQNLWGVFLTISGVALAAALWLKPGIFKPEHLVPTSVIFTAFTLLIYAWNYNPVSPRSSVISPFISSLQSYGRENGLPPRLYSREDLLNSSNSAALKSTDPISPKFSVFQPVNITVSNPCFDIPMNPPVSGGRGGLTVSLRNELAAEPLRQIALSVSEVSARPDQHLCFDNVKQPGRYVLSFSSDNDSGVNLAVYPEPLDSLLAAYLVRKPQPSPEDIFAAKKPLRVNLSTAVPATRDVEGVTLARHLQAVAPASSARWIGALSIRPYREFIEMFFANDREVLDGDGIHVLDRYQRLFNLAGITHFVQVLNEGAQDNMPAAGFRLTQSEALGSKQARLYTNPDAFPKAFLVHDAIFKAADDDARYAMLENDFNPRQLIYISGDTPPRDLAPASGKLASGSISITKYSDLKVEAQVETAEGNWLVLADSATPQWHAKIDEQPAPLFVADTMFKTVYVPAGNHKVTFYYDSPAVNQAKYITAISLVILIVLLILSFIWPRKD